MRTVNTSLRAASAFALLAVAAATLAPQPAHAGGFFSGMLQTPFLGLNTRFGEASAGADAGAHRDERGIKHKFGPQTQLAASRRAARLGLIPRMPELDLSRLGTDDFSVPTMTVLVHETLVAKITGVITPLLDALATSTPVPAQNTDHYQFPSFNLTSFDLGSVEAGFQSPDVVTATFHNVSLTVPHTPLYVYEEVFGHKFGCHGTFWGSAADSQFTVSLALGRSPLNGSLLVTDVDVQATFGTLSVGHTFDGDVCSIIGHVIGFFLGGVNNEMKALIQEELPAKMANVIRNTANNVSSSSVLRLASLPNVTDDSLMLVADLNPTNNTPVNVPPPDLAGFPPRDAEIYVSEASINTVLAIDAAQGTFAGKTVLPDTFNTSTIRSLLPAAYDACNDCYFIATTSPQAPPFAAVGAQSVALTLVDFHVNLQAFNATVAPVDLMTISLDLGFELSNITVLGDNADTVFFQVSLPQLSASVVDSKIGKLAIPTIVEIAAYLLRTVLINTFNEQFGGITLPNIDGFSTSQLVLDLSQGRIAVGVNVDVPSSTKRA